MQKTFAIMLTVLLVMSTNIFAQKFIVGVKGGLNLANIALDPTPSVDINSRTGMVAGAYVGINFGDFCVEPEFTYSMKGMKFTSGMTNITCKLDFFEIPVLVKYNIPLRGNVTPTIFVGPTIGFTINAKLYGESGGSSMESDIDDYIKSTDFGLVFGAGIDINIGGVIITLDGRYNLGLTDLNNNWIPGYTMKTNAIQILAGVGFPIK